MLCRKFGPIQSSMRLNTQINGVELEPVSVGDFLFCDTSKSTAGLTYTSCSSLQAHAVLFDTSPTPKCTYQQVYSPSPPTRRYTQISDTGKQHTHTLTKTAHTQRPTIYKTALETSRQLFWFSEIQRLCYCRERGGYRQSFVTVPPKVWPRCWRTDESRSPKNKTGSGWEKKHIHTQTSD